MQQAGGGEARRAAVEASAADAADGHPEVGDAAPCQAGPAAAEAWSEVAADGSAAVAWSEVAADGFEAAAGACLAEPGCCCQGVIAEAWSEAAADGSFAVAEGAPEVLFAAVKV